MTLEVKHHSDPPAGPCYWHFTDRNGSSQGKKIFLKNINTIYCWKAC